MSVTHVAGPAVEIRGRVVQRCMWCGEKLCDSLNASAPLNPDGTPPVFPIWKTGNLVEHDGARHTDAGPFEGPAPLPENFCLDMVE